MALQKVVLVALVCCAAVLLRQEVHGQSAGGKIGLGLACTTRASCDSKFCNSNQNICCSGYKWAQWTGSNATYVLSNGKCTCCEGACSAGFAHAYGATQSTKAHVDVYLQVCSVTH